MGSERSRCAARKEERPGGGGCLLRLRADRDGAFPFDRKPIGLGLRSGLGLQFLPQPGVVGGLLLRADQAQFGLVHFVQQPLRQLTVLAQRERAKVDRAAGRRQLNHVAVLFEQRDPQQAAMVRRLLLRRNPQPFVVRVEVFLLGSLGRRRLGRRGPCDLGLTLLFERGDDGLATGTVFHVLGHGFRGGSREFRPRAGGQLLRVGMGVGRHKSGPMAAWNSAPRRQAYVACLRTRTRWHSEARSCCPGQNPPVEKSRRSPGLRPRSRARARRG